MALMDLIKARHSISKIYGRTDPQGGSGYHFRGRQLCIKRTAKYH